MGQAAGGEDVISGGLINGGTAMEFESTKEAYRKRGAAITDGMTDEEVLAAMEAFEDNPPGLICPVWKSAPPPRWSFWQ